MLQFSGESLFHRHMKPSSTNPTQPLRLCSFALSDEGRKRDHNEDAVLSDPDHGLFCVADGMGGLRDGEVASATVVEMLGKAATDRLGPGDEMGPSVAADALREAHTALRELATRKEWFDKDGRAQIGTTASVLLLDTVSRKAEIVHIGDSRVYRLRGRKLEQLSTDHSLEAELRRELGGEDSRFNFGLTKGVLRRAVALDDVLDLEHLSFDLHHDDLFLLCSDGLNLHLSDPEIRQTLLKGRGQHVGRAGRRLVALANAAGGKDNISVVLVRPRDPVVLCRRRRLLATAICALFLLTSLGIAATCVMRRRVYARKVASQVAGFVELLGQPKQDLRGELKVLKETRDALPGLLPEARAKVRASLLKRQEAYQAIYTARVVELLRAQDWPGLHGLVIPEVAAFPEGDAHDRFAAVVGVVHKRELLEDLWWQLSVAMEARSFAKLHDVADSYARTVAPAVPDGPAAKLTRLRLNELEAPAAVTKLLGQWPFGSAMGNARVGLEKAREQYQREQRKNDKKEPEASIGPKDGAPHFAGNAALPPPRVPASVDTDPLLTPPAQAERQEVGTLVASPAARQERPRGDEVTIVAEPRAPMAAVNALAPDLSPPVGTPAGGTKNEPTDGRESTSVHIVPDRQSGQDQPSLPGTTPTAANGAGDRSDARPAPGELGAGDDLQEPPPIAAGGSSLQAGEKDTPSVVPQSSMPAAPSAVAELQPKAEPDVPLPGANTGAPAKSSAIPDPAASPDDVQSGEEPAGRNALSPVPAGAPDEQGLQERGRAAPQSQAKLEAIAKQTDSSPTAGLAAPEPVDVMTQFRARVKGEGILAGWEWVTKKGAAVSAEDMARLEETTVAYVRNAWKAVVTAHYAGADRLWSDVVERLSQLQRPGLEKRLGFERRSMAASFWTRADTLMNEAWTNGDWAPIRPLLTGNPRMSAANFPAAELSAARAWLALTDACEKDSQQAQKVFLGLSSTVERRKDMMRLAGVDTGALEVSSRDLRSPAGVCRRFRIVAETLCRGVFSCADLCRENARLVSAEDLGALLTRVYPAEEQRKSMQALFDAVAQRTEQASSRAPGPPPSADFPGISPRELQGLVDACDQYLADQMKNAADSFSLLRQVLLQQQANSLSFSRNAFPDRDVFYDLLGASTSLYNLDEVKTLRRELHAAVTVHTQGE
ncbi:MAG: SpoIIE family protein phosphatase [Lentisphaerae bacterium]|nr:SpoIIE family protein phosphatase [Lentisphaerota bacterium]MBT5607287.1 SpoIIE family protein phosphatase [Lentisphaerota bacterium]MBT7060229.1 SpoIIE family protein phosphatase [Lentisphaerota bacterium]MBT7842485.1 SpoIIE family protein phosphatase [Lentisphaerota bacterium]